MRLSLALLCGFAALALALATHLFARSAHSSRAAIPPVQASVEPVTLEWVGDMALSSQLGLPPGGLDRALEPVSRILHGADITLGNLEGTLSVGSDSKCASAASKSCFAFQAPPAVAGQLKALGFDLVNQANNHSLDFGQSGRSQTISALNRAKLPFTGLPGQITFLQAKGRRVAFVGFAPYPYTGDLLNLPAAEALVRRARRHASLVVVIIHAGAEGADRIHTPRGTEYYLGENRGDSRAFAHGVIDAGASVVLGSGPHVVRGVERYHRRLIAYSLGNFVGYRTLGTGGDLSTSGALRVTLGAGGAVLRARWISITLPDGLPRPDPGRAGAMLVAALSREDFPGRHFAIGPSGMFHLGPASGR